VDCRLQQQPMPFEMAVQWPAPLCVVRFTWKQQGAERGHRTTGTTGPAGCWLAGWLAAGSWINSSRLARAIPRTVRAGLLLRGGLSIYLKAVFWVGVPSPSPY
jgi:hypothetical protein